MRTEIAYIDESYDETVFAMSAVIVPVHTWTQAFTYLQGYRKYLKTKYGIFTSKELHATDFVAGRGRIAPTFVPKHDRALIFKQTMTVLTKTPGLRIVSGAWVRDGADHDTIHTKAFSRIQERLQMRCLKNDYHIISIVDEGRAKELRRIARRSKKYNPVGSQFGAWEDGSPYKNIPNDRLIEDPFFKSSEASYFLQAADFVAFALLKSEVPPTPNIAKHGINDAYATLEPICATEASAKDPRNLGIVRT